MAHSWELYENGSLFGIIYHFKDVSDGIAMHRHEEQERHNIVVLRGAIAVYGPDRAWTQILMAGAVFDMTAEHDPHEVYSLSPDTKTLHLFIHGKPADFREALRRGWVSLPPTYPSYEWHNAPPPYDP